jgi:hypothetical protein
LQALKNKKYKVSKPVKASKEKTKDTAQNRQKAFQIKHPKFFNCSFKYLQANLGTNYINLFIHHKQSHYRG